MIPAEDNATFNKKVAHSPTALNDQCFFFISPFCELVSLFDSDGCERQFCIKPCVYDVTFWVVTIVSPSLSQPHIERSIRRNK